ncbi:MAG TPA: Fic family protein [Candidatus Baltobacteraceae bacterium]
MTVEDPGAFGALTASQIERLSGALFHLHSKLVKTVRTPEDWSIPFLYDVHRSIFRGLFRDEAGRERRVEVVLRDLPVPPVTQIQYRLQTIVQAIRDLVTRAGTLSGAEKINAVFAEAARIHADCICVQPFVDGNKRWARVILSAFLADCGYSPGTEIPEVDHDRYMEGISKSVNEAHPEQLAALLLAGWVALRQAYREATRSGSVSY